LLFCRDGFKKLHIVQQRFKNSDSAFLMEEFGFSLT